MFIKPIGVYQEACQVKHRFPTKHDAELARQRMMMTGRMNSKLHVYQCLACSGGWHISHSLPKKERRTRLKWWKRFEGILDLSEFISE